MKSIIEPLGPPENAGWVLLGDYSTLFGANYPVAAYEHKNGLFVLSAVEVAIDGDGVDKGAEYHLSITKRGQRCSTAEALWVLAQFGLLEAEEDNHAPNGKARNFSLTSENTKFTFSTGRSKN